MFVVIVGGGRLGLFLARFFSRRGDRVVVVDRRRAVCDRIAKELDVVVYCGDARCARVLRDAEADKADVLFAVTGSDSVNVKVAEIAKRELGVPLVVVRVNRAESKGRALKAGADRVVCMGDFAEHFVSMVTSKGYRFLTKVGGEVVVELDVPPDSPVVGSGPKDLEKRGVTLLAAAHGGRPLRKTELESYVVRADDKLLVMGEEDRVEEFLDYVFSG